MRAYTSRGSSNLYRINPRPGYLWMKAAAMLLLSLFLKAELQAQSALDGFDPNADGGVLVVAVQPDGKILIGGTFTTISPNGGAPVARNCIARLNSDGTLDPVFNPIANGRVRVIEIQPDGKILVGGVFTSIGGQMRNRIARLDPRTGLADSFDPNATGMVTEVNAIALQPDGKVVVGGAFTNIGGQPRIGLARLDGSSGLADSFDAHTNSFVDAIKVQEDGKILVGGSFSGANSIGGQTRNGIARLDPTTGLADSFDPNVSGVVRTIAVQADGKILLGGDFTSVGGQTRNRIARVDNVTGLPDSFDPNANSQILAIVVQADGKILVGGTFLLAGIGGQMRSGIARLDATTGQPDSFNPSPSDPVISIALQADGKILAGGAFTSIGGQTRNRIARLETDGSLDRTLNLGTVGSRVCVSAVQPDGKLLIGGNFTSVLGVARNNLARLNLDGTLDTAFDPNANDQVLAIAVQTDGKILVGGQFNGANSIGGQTRNFIARLDAANGLADSFDPSANGSVSAIVPQVDGKILVAGGFNGANSIGGQSRNRIARLDPATGLADSFNPNANNVVNSIGLQTDGKILVGGQFNGANSIGGQTRNHIARLDAGTGLADSFDPNANFYVYFMAVQPDGKILVSGAFSGANSIGGQTRNHLARLDPVTGLADSFDPNVNGTDVASIALQADGKILVGGFFSGIGGQPRSHIARLDATTGLADSFNPDANWRVDSIALQADGKILAGGSFTTMSGQPRNLFARLSNDTAALQDLAVTPTAITWAHGGSSPQCTRVTFEYSDNGVTYAALGHATQSGSNWSLIGLNLPTGQNIYIRARGYCRSGQLNGSESIMESVRNAFLSAPAGTPTPSPTVAPTPAATATPTPLATATPSPTAAPTPTPSPSVTPTPAPTPTPASGCQAPSFAAAVNFGAGDAPLSVTTGDFNADGKLDLATANMMSGNVSVLLGNGIGGFARAVNFGAGNGLFSVTTGDFNSDGNLDLAAANQNSNGISVLLGNGMGGFAPAGTWVAGGGPISVTTGDFNSDGNLDVAAANQFSDNVSVVFNNGTGGFFPVNFGAGNGPLSVTTGDFNADGKLDLATANQLSDNVSVLLGNGMGGFAVVVNFGAGSAPRSVTTGDFNADGKLDLAVANQNSNNVSVLLGNGTGGFAAAVNFGVSTAPGSVTTGDFNADGKLDLAVANRDSDDVSVLLNTCTAIGTPTPTPTPGCDDTWMATSLTNAPSARDSHTAVWTGSEMIVWGGFGAGFLNTGGRYNPTTGSWTATSTVNAPAGRVFHTAVWTGSEMIVWGGYSGVTPGVYLNTGGRYNPSTDTWTTISVTNAPSARGRHTAIWTGSEMIVWGGSEVTGSTGGRYRPSTDTWTGTSTADAPSSRFNHTAIWSGYEMIVWGGEVMSFRLDTGGSYVASTDTWTATSIAPPGRTGHTAIWTGSKMTVWGGAGNSGLLQTGAMYDPGTNSWTATSVTNAPSARSLHTAVSTGQEMIVWGGGGGNTGGRYNFESNSWTATSTTNAPSGRMYHTAVWTGGEMIVWGGYAGGTGQVNTGARYCAHQSPTPTPTPATPTPTPATPTPTPGCIDDTWSPTSNTNSPLGRSNHTAVWTGSEMIVWGGGAGNAVDYPGGRYSRDTNSWTSVSTTNAPVKRSTHTGIWTGSEMIVWGGFTFSGTYLNTGGRYSPGTDSWNPMSTTNAPTVRHDHTAVWTGSEMIIWGGSDLNTGARYNPLTDSWTSISTVNAPVGRSNHTAIWTGSEMIVWGGSNGPGFNTGGRYNPATDSWTPTSTVNAPAGRSDHTAVWTGSEMIVWGGSDGSSGSSLNTGARYNPVTDTWTSTSITDAPSQRRAHTAVWTGHEMIVWGGNGAPALNSGGQYDPSTNTWTAVSSTNAPTPREFHTAVWTGLEMIVWGGNNNPLWVYLTTGGRYCVAQLATPTPTPTPTPTATATPTATVAATPTPTPTTTIAPTASPTATVSPTATSTPTATATVAPTPTPTPTSTPAAQALNLSTRMQVQTGDDVGIGGFIVAGTAPKHVVLRAMGPSLAQAGVPDALADPMLELHGPAGFVTVINDNWRDDQELTIAATGLAPANNLEAAIEATLAPGAYTAIVKGKSNTSGVALVEVYDINQSAASRLANLSTRALVGTGDNIVIAGFILGGGASDDRIVVRGIGPSLSALGVANALADPKLELRNSDGALLASNNDWQDDPAQAAELTAAGLAPGNNLESGLAEALPPGLYTVLLSGLNNSAGIGLVEIYDRGMP